MTLVLLVTLGRLLNVTTFGSLMRRIFGKAGSLVFQMTLISVLFLALTAMQRVVLDLLPIFVESICGLIPGTVKPLALSMLATWAIKWIKTASKRAITCYYKANLNLFLNSIII